MEVDLTSIVDNCALIDKFVAVKTDDRIYNGFVDAIDPISKSVVLSSSCGGRDKTCLVMGHAIIDIQVQQTPAGFERVKSEVKQGPEPMESKARKGKVFDWLLRNLLPVTEVDDVLHVHNGCLKIHPPYGAEDCTSNNAIILGRVQHLLTNIPKVGEREKDST